MWRRWLVGEDFLYSDFKFHWIERLDNIVFCTNFQQTNTLAGRVLAGEHNHRNVLEQLILLDPLQDAGGGGILAYDD